MLTLDVQKLIVLVVAQALLELSFSHPKQRMSSVALLRSLLLTSQPLVANSSGTVLGEPLDGFFRLGASRGLVVAAVNAADGALTLPANFICELHRYLGLPRTVFAPLAEVSEVGSTDEGALRAATGSASVVAADLLDMRAAVAHESLASWAPSAAW